MATRATERPYAVNRLADYQGVGGYFLDMRPVISARGRSRRVALGVVSLRGPTLAERALAWWERHLRGERDAARRFGELARRLRTSAELRGDGLLWQDGKAARTCGRGRPASFLATQGHAASVLAREYMRSGDDRHAADARRTIAPVVGHGSAVDLTSVLRDGPSLVEGGASLTFSGVIFALWGLRDVAVALTDAEFRQAYEQATDALAGALSYYDTGWWTRHSLGGDGSDVATVDCHRLHIAQAEAMARLTGRREFAHAVMRWRRYDCAPARARVRTLAGRRKLGLPRPQLAARPAKVRAVVHGPYPADSRVRRESLAFRDAGLDVEVVCQRQDGERRGEVVDGVRVTRLGVEHAGRGTLRAVLREYFGFTAAAGLALAHPVSRGQPELVHVHAPPDFLLAAGLAPRLRGARLLLDIHDLSRDMFASRFADGIGARAGAAALALVERLACAIADQVVTVHEPYADELARSGVPREKISVVMNAIDERALEPALRRRMRTGPHDGFTVAYHGTVAPWYGLDLLIDAVASARADVPGIRALIVGRGDAVEATRRRAHELGVTELVELVGELPHAETLDRIAGADCGVIPNKPTKLNRFALSSKLFEYVALGIPVAVARLETLAQHFDEDEVAFFTPGDSSSLAAALVSIASDPQGARARAERARARARANYSWARNREELLTRAFELIPEPPSAAWTPHWWTAAGPA